MSWVLLSEHKAACSVDNFYSGVNVWLKRPNVINRRLLGAVTVVEEEELTCPRWSTTNGEDDMVRGRQLLTTLSRLYCEEMRPNDGVDKAAETSMSGSQTAMKLKGVVRQLLPKMRSSPKGWEAVLVDEMNHCFVFCPVANFDPPCSVPQCSYKIQFTGQEDSSSSSSLSRISILVRRPLTSVECEDTSAAPPTHAHSANGITVPTHDWLRSVLLPKVAQWSEENFQQVPTAGRSRRGESLIPLGRYSQLYAELKEKYGPTLVENWPEGTDPHKFVYEDIAIATYLLVLWEEERHELSLKQKQSFIDLGCGNGLLVYLLTSEGHPGKGIDLRERKIWTMYQGKARLEVCSLEPSETTVFPDYDWLVGNHSDELTPWIPVMASRSSFTTRYFVLPCCAHDFNKKFSRPTTRQSQYQCYLDYVREIGERMGFVVEEDVMRIPSSKRVCQVGMKRNYPISEETRIDQSRRAFLIERCGYGYSTSHAYQGLAQNDHDDFDGPCDQQATTGKTKYARNVVNTNATRCHPRLTGDLPSEHFPPDLELGRGAEKPRGNVDSPRLNLVTGFTPRDPKESVRNCSHVNQEVKKFIVNTLTQQLLQTENYITLGRFQDERVSCEASLRPSIAVSPLSHWRGAPSDVNENVGVASRTSGIPVSEAKLKSYRYESDLKEAGEGECTSDCTCDVQSGCCSTGATCSTHACTEAEGLKESHKLVAAVGESVGEEARWNLGGKIHLSEAAAMFDSQVLSQLKSECGGLQTLLRNEHQIFKVSGGYIRLRNWSELDHPPRKPTDHLSRSQKEAKNLLFKTKLCWFHLTHPQGCPRRSSDCPYAHGEEEQRERPNFKDILDCSKELLSLT